MDKHQGNSGTYLVSGGARVRATPDKDGNVRAGEQVLHRPDTRPHAEGDAPRDASGERIDRDAAHEAAAKPQAAFPEPASTPPWAAPQATASGTAATDPDVPQAGTARSRTGAK